MEYTEDTLREIVRTSCANNGAEGYVMSQSEEDRIYNELKTELIDKKRPLKEVISDFQK